MQRGDFDFDITRTKQQITFGFHLNGQYLRDENQKFGYLGGPKFTDEEWGPTPKAFIEWAPSRGRFSTDTRVELPFQFHHFNIHPPAGIILPQSRGWVNGAAPTFHQFLAYDLTRFDADRKPTGHLGPVNLGLTPACCDPGPGDEQRLRFRLRLSPPFARRGSPALPGRKTSRFLRSRHRHWLLRDAAIRAVPVGRQHGAGTEQGEFVAGMAFDQSFSRSRRQHGIGVALGFAQAGSGRR